MQACRRGMWSLSSIVALTCWVGCAGSVVSGAAGNFRAQLLELAHHRIEVEFADKSSLDDPKTRDNVVYQLTKADKACGNDGVPVMFLDFEIEGVRPVDVFNVLFDAVDQPKWDTQCGKISFLTDARAMQARGLDATFLAKPLSSREALEWQVVSANFTTQEFWVVFTTEGNDDLKARWSIDPSNVEFQNCLGAYKVVPSGKGVHVVGTQQVNSHPSPLTARGVANMAWGKSIDWAVALRKASAEQAAKGWNETNITAPSWMLSASGCHTDSEDHIRSSVLELANTELRGPRGQELPPAHLPDGSKLQMWRQDRPCGGHGVASAKLTAWRAEFCLAGAQPIDVFNVLIAKRQEPQWNKVLKNANTSGFYAGARRVHEAFQMPKILWHTWAVRELWEWQVADHSLENNTYVVAVTSQASPYEPKFSKDSVEAAQCLAAYQLLPAPECNGTQVMFVQRLNPNIPLAGGLAKFFPDIGRSLVMDFSATLTSEAQKRAHHGLKIEGDEQADVDGEVLGLLAPARPGRNESATLRCVLSAPARLASQVFASLDFPRLLDSTNWTSADFGARAKEVHDVFKLFADNATEAEAACFADSPAKNGLQLQIQGEALSRIQIRIIDCLCESAGPPLPDPNRHEQPRGWSLQKLIVVGALAAFGLLSALGGCCCCWFKRLRRRRASRAAATTAPRSTVVSMQNTSAVLLESELEGGAA